jgi:hypothetical protein
MVIQHIYSPQGEYIMTHNTRFNAARPLARTRSMRTGSMYRSAKKIYKKLRQAPWKYENFRVELFMQE